MTRQPPRPPGKPVGTRVLLLASGGVALLVLGIAATLMLLRGGSGAERARSLQGQLLTAGMELPAAERNQLLTQLMRTVDEMDREEMKQLRQQWWKSRMDHLEQVIGEYRGATKVQQGVILDQEIDQIIRTRDIDAALLGLPRHGTSWGGRPGQRNARPRGSARAANPKQEERRQFFQALQQRADQRGIALGGG